MLSKCRCRILPSSEKYTSGSSMGVEEEEEEEEVCFFAMPQVIPAALRQ
jgi:hypothetical protein